MLERLHDVLQREESLLGGGMHVRGHRGWSIGDYVDEIEHASLFLEYNFQSSLCKIKLEMKRRH